MTVDLGAGQGVSVGTDTLRSFRGVIAGAGNDTSPARPADEVISAGPGNDIVNAGAGNDTIDGGPGNDLLRGGYGRDVIDRRRRSRHRDLRRAQRPASRSA